jgi:uncharacterized protein YbjQ (UPF0145 family)
MSELPMRSGRDEVGACNDIIMTTCDTVPGYHIVRTVGLVRGNTVRTRHAGHDIMAVFKTLVGGEVENYTKMIAESREQALDRMAAEALDRGANAIVAIRFCTSEIMTGAAELLAYGTGLVIEKDE